ncbi:DUF3048 domain-containing protein [Streptomyces sp. NBC_00199]|uniref:DUF3048 domain-containing protein n=1 Tax=Streptomyces sp. NBC_00199 TaxID=2975678 RepID=UPI00224FDE1A|nr:DUF3048 domain-containing protein [Streptomyces sp. NBC_00199]MCX5267633.1 DUF3048 domain-containing protein [Streptomyces sp. NBC_00199]
MSERVPSRPKRSRRPARPERAGRSPAAAALLASALAAALAVSLTAGCTTSREPSGDDGRSASQKPSPGGDRPSAVAAPVLAVKIDNAPPARPQTGLDAADVVYVEQVEGGLSRLMAVYATRLPKAVGPVRSARESDLELLRQFHQPVLAFSGAQGRLLPLIDRAPLDAVTPSDASGAYFRGADRAAPHNLFLRPSRLLPSAPGAAALTTGFRYGPAPSGGTTAASRTVRYPAARFTFTWSASRAGWLVSTDGAATRTSDGQPLAPATVVVQYVKVRASRFHDFLGNNTPYTETVGSGKAQVLRDGRAYDVNWRRGTATDGTDFTTADGAPVAFARGQVWVVFANASSASTSSSSSASQASPASNASPADGPVSRAP